MNRNLLFIFIIIFVFSLSIFSSKAQARSANSFNSEGVAVGSAIVGNEAIQHQKQYASRKYSRRHGPGYGYRDHRRYGYRGYWRMKNGLAPRFYKRVWNPGHYNRYGQWIRGHWVVINDRPDY